MISRCKLCGFEPVVDVHVIHIDASLTLVKCPVCGFVFDRDIDVSVPQAATGVGVASGVDLYLSRVEASRVIWSKEADRILRSVTFPGRILDVGCGIGGFLEIAKEKGFDVYGVELNPDAVHYIRSRGLFPIFTSIQETKDLGLQFDVVTILHTLEHVSDPKQMLRETRDVLKPNGLLVVTVPCYNRLTLLLDRSRNYTGWALVHKGHQNYFSLSTLQFLLRQEGFQIVKHQFGLFGACVQRRLSARMKGLSRCVVELLLVFVRILHLLGIDINLTVYTARAS